VRTFWLARAWTRVTQNYYCNPSQGSSSFFRASRRTHSCHKPISGLHEYDTAKTSASAASSPVLRAALSRSPAKGWLEMSILRHSEQSSNSSQEISQSVGRRLRGKPDHVVFRVSRESTFKFAVKFARHQRVPSALRYGGQGQS
jgi:hypothetical protein